MFRRLALMGFIVLCTVTGTSCAERQQKRKRRSRTPSPQPLVKRRPSERIPTDLEKEEHIKQTTAAQRASFDIYLELERKKAEKEFPKKNIWPWKSAVEKGRRLHTNINDKHFDSRVGWQTFLLLETVPFYC